MPKISQSGNRIYIFETVNQVPSINEVISYPEKYNTFIDSVTLNPKNANAKLYSHFSKENYSSFIYSLAYQFGHLGQSANICKQFEMNARKIEKLCKRKKIPLSIIECIVIDKCKNFHLLELVYTSQFSLSQTFLLELADLYL